MRLVHAAFVLAALVNSASAKAERAPEIAFTFDDLPLHEPIPEGDTPQSVANGIIAALTHAHIPAYGFVNAHWTVDEPATLEVLKAWRAAGLTLGNHGWSHQHLSPITLEQFEVEVARGEPVLQQLSLGTDWRWFRYPFLDEGKDAGQRQAARDVLARRGYKIADVTMDFGDWQWTAPYARCRAVHDEASIAKLKQLYLSAARDSIVYYRGLSHQLFGRDIPYVILLHESAFEARMLPQLIGLFNLAGFRFVSLPHAESDSYYASRVDPERPAQPSGLDATAKARGVKLPHRSDFASQLASICQSGAPVATVP